MIALFCACIPSLKMLSPPYPILMSCLHAEQQKEEVFKQLFKDPTNLSLLFKYANLSILVGDLRGRHWGL